MRESLCLEGSSHEDVVEDCPGMEKVMCKRPGARMNLLCLDSLKQKGQRIEVWWAGATQGQRVLGARYAFRILFVRVAVFPGCGLAPGTSLVLWLVFRNIGKRDEAQTGGVVVVRRAASLGSAEGLLHCCETSWPCRPSPLGFAPAGCYSLGLESHCAAASRPRQPVRDSRGLAEVLSVGSRRQFWVQIWLLCTCGENVDLKTRTASIFPSRGAALMLQLRGPGSVCRLSF